MRKCCVGLLALLVSMTLFAERVSVDDATLVANHFMNPASASSVKKAMPAKRMVHKATAEENRYYVYQNEDGEGWVIIAADDAVNPILAYSETGTFRTENMPSNLRNWMGKYNHFIERLENDGVVASEETQAQWQALRQGTRRAPSAVVVGPLIQTQWDQDSPYWNQCPGSTNNRAYTGCVATAMAQLMKYWEWPVQGTGSHSYRPLDPNDPEHYSSRYTSTLSANFANTTYDWENMRNSYIGSYTTAEAIAVATLMYHCGVATEMMYGNSSDGGSGTYTLNYGDWTWGVSTTDEGGCAQNALCTYFGYKREGLTGYMRDGYVYGGTTYYDSWTDANWTAMIKEELDLQHPIMYSGASSEGGHCFICDGYRSDNYFHFNWGWSGSGDGYYLLSNLNPGGGGAGGGSYNFSEDQEVIIGIVPDRTDLPPVHVTWSVNGVASDPVEVSNGSLITLPETPADCPCGKVFAGWTAQATIADGAKPADLFTTNKGKVATEDITYYAVFADRSEEGGEPAEVAKVTFKTASSDSNTDNSANIASILVNTDSGIASYSGSKLYLGKSGMKMGTGQTTGNITLTLENTVPVSNIIINASQYVGQSGNPDSGQLKVTAGASELGAQTPASNLQYTADPAVETNTITVATTYKRAYIASISVIAGTPASFSNYSLDCDCGGSALENASAASKAVKVIENGQIIIIRDNKKYSILGQNIK